MANKEAIREWIADLRSGKFKQGRGQLRQGDRFCCLGVACETFRRVTGNGRWVEDSFFPDDSELEEVYILPEPVAHWLGFGIDTSPALSFPHGVRYCSEANDDDRKRFSTIAAAIERTFLAESPS